MRKRKSYVFHRLGSCLNSLEHTTRGNSDSADDSPDVRTIVRTIVSTITVSVNRYTARHYVADLSIKESLLPLTCFLSISKGNFWLPVDDTTASSSTVVVTAASD